MVLDKCLYPNKTKQNITNTNNFKTVSLNLVPVTYALGYTNKVNLRGLNFNDSSTLLNVEL